MNIAAALKPPYFYHADKLPGLDFNREIVEPGTHDVFPEGALGIRVDGDFWAVAALPLSYRDTPLKDIVASLWPQYIEEASFGADSGTVEQRVEFATAWAQSQECMIRSLNKRVHELDDQLARLRAGRHDLHERHSKRHRAFNDYFIRQYEHLLVAVAHEAEPRQDAKGICGKCGLYCSDRVHQKHFINLHAKGYEPDTEHLATIRDEDDE